MAIGGYYVRGRSAAVGVLLRDGNTQYPYYCRSLKTSPLNLFLLITYIATFARPPKRDDVLHVWLPQTFHEYAMAMAGISPFHVLRRRMDVIRLYLASHNAHAFLHEVDPTNREHAELVKGMNWTELAGKAEVSEQPPPDAPLLDWEKLTWLSVNDPQMYGIYHTPRTKAWKTVRRYWKALE